jgi:hypothetical protein
LIFAKIINQSPELVPTLMSLEEAESLAEWEIEFFGKLLVVDDEFRGQAGIGSAY